MNNKKENIIVYTEDNTSYNLNYDDFRKVQEYCENECMGFKFLMSADILRKLVDNLMKRSIEPPYGISKLTNIEFYNDKEGKSLLKYIKDKLGTDDLKLVARIVIKQTFKFLYKT